jgi:hypothetical protein
MAFIIEETKIATDTGEKPVSLMWLLEYLINSQSSEIPKIFARYKQLLEYFNKGGSYIQLKDLSHCRKNDKLVIAKYEVDLNGNIIPTALLFGTVKDTNQEIREIALLDGRNNSDIVFLGYQYPLNNRYFNIILQIKN